MSASQMESRTLLSEDKSRYVVLRQEGGRIALSAVDGRPFLSEIVRGNGASASTHVCAPFFGPETVYAPEFRYGFGQHGPVRNMHWDVLASGRDVIALGARVEHEGYPSVHVIQRHEVDDNGHTIVLVQKHSGETGQHAPENMGIHFYWPILNMTEADQATVNGVAVGRILEDADHTFIDINDTVNLELPGTGQITLSQEGFETAVVWRGKNPNGDPDRNYVCVEPVRKHPLSVTYDGAHMIRAGEFREARVRITGYPE